MKNKFLFLILTLYFFNLIQINGCINFDDWENNKHEKKNFNDLGLPIAIYPNPSINKNTIPSDFCLEEEMLISLEDLKKLIMMEPLRDDSILTQDSADKLLNDYELIKDDLENIFISPCMEKAIDYYSKYIDSSINCITAYKESKQEDFLKYCSNMKMYQSQFFEEISKIEECTPKCKP